MRPVVHAVTTDDVLRQPDFLGRAHRVLAAGGPRVALHVRGGRTTGRILHELAEALVPLAAQSGAWIVVNDRPDIALATGAQGTQLTSRSLTVADARRIAPALPLGASVHGTGDARAAAADGADWVVAGNIFHTTSHPGRDGRGVEFAAAIVRAVGVPVIAIGGIRPAHVGPLREAGVAGVAIIRGVWESSDAGAAIADYLSEYDGARGNSHGQHPGQR